MIPPENISCQMFDKVFDNTLARMAMRSDYSKGMAKLTY